MFGKGQKQAVYRCQLFSHKGQIYWTLVFSVHFLSSFLRLSCSVLLERVHSKRKQFHPITTVITEAVATRAKTFTLQILRPHVSNWPQSLGCCSRFHGQSSSSWTQTVVSHGHKVAAHLAFCFTPATLFLAVSLTAAAEEPGLNKCPMFWLNGMGWNFQWVGICNFYPILSLHTCIKVCHKK